MFFGKQGKRPITANKGTLVSGLNITCGKYIISTYIPLKLSYSKFYQLTCAKVLKKKQKIRFSPCLVKQGKMLNKWSQWPKIPDQLKGKIDIYTL